MLVKKLLSLYSCSSCQFFHGLTAFTVVLSLTILTTAGSAQDVVSGVTETSSQIADNGDDGEDKKPTRHLIYLPYKQLIGVFGQFNSSVVVPYVEYMKLLEANEGRPAPAKFPVKAVIASTEYKAIVKKETATIQCKLKLRSLAEGWTQLALPIGNVAVGEWKPSDERVILQGDKNGQYSVLLPDKGNYEVEVSMTTRVRSAPEGKSFEIKVPAVGISTFEVAVPEENQTINISPNSVALQTKPNGKETRVKVNLGASDKVAVSWVPKVSDKPQMDLLTSVTNHTLVSIQDDLVHTDAYLTYDVLRGSLNQVRIVVPKSHRILDVSADAKMKSWKTEEQDGRQLIVIDLLSELTKALHVEVHTESELGDEPIDLGGIDEDGNAFGVHVLDAVREHGQLVVVHSSDTTLTINDRQGLARIEQAEIAQKIRKTAAIGFKYYSPKYRLVLDVKPVQPKVSVNHTARVEFIDDELRLFTNLVYNIEKTGIFELQIKLPDGFELDELQCPKLKDYSEDEATNTLKVLLNEKTQGQLSITIRGHLEFDNDAEEVELELPLLLPENVEREIGDLYVLAPQSMEIITDRENLAAAQPRPIPNIQGSSTRLRAISAWSFTRRPVTIPVKTVRKPTRLSATVATKIETAENLIDVVTKVIFNVEYAGVDTFRIAVPEAISEKIQIEAVNSDSSAPGIKQKTAAEETEDGWVTWTIVMQREVSGEQVFEVRYDIPVGEAEKENAEGDDAEKPKPKKEGESYKVTLVRPLGLDADSNNGKETELSSVFGETSIHKTRALSVRADIENETIERIDIRELQYLAADGFFAFRYYDGDETIEVDLSLKKFAIQEVVETVVSRALVEVVTGRDNTVTYLCRYRIRTSERQRLALDLPSGAEPLALFVDERSVELEKRDAATATDGWDPYYIPVSRAGNSEESFLLTIQFRWPVHPMPFEYIGGKIAVPIPQIGMNQAGSAIQHLQTVVWVPKEFSLVGEPKDFLLKKKPTLEHAIDGKLGSLQNPEYLKQELNNWIGGDASALVEFPTQGRPYAYTNLGGAPQLTVTWWSKTWFTIVISGAILVIAFFLRTTSWSNKFGFLLVAAFLVALFAQIDADRVLHGIEAARLGLLGLAGLWLIQAIAGLRHWIPKRSDFTSKREGTSSLASTPWTQAAVVPPPGIFDDIANGGSSK